MKTTEYLWWVETIRQENFRRITPLILITWISFAFFLIFFTLYFLTKPQLEIEKIYINSCLICFFISMLGIIIEMIIANVVDKKIKKVKQLWEASNSNESYPKELNYFYANYLKTK